MSDNDLIRRGDAKAICGTIIRNDEAARIEGYLDALPAVHPVASAPKDATLGRESFVSATPSPDVVEIDLRAVMMEEIEKAAGQSPWVPPEYTMNEIVSDCCSFLREPREPSPDVAGLVEAAEKLLDAYSAIVGAGNPWGDELRAAIAHVKGVM